MDDDISFSCNKKDFENYKTEVLYTALNEFSHLWDMFGSPKLFAHELNTPLTVVSGSLQIIRRYIAELFSDKQPIASFDEEEIQEIVGELKETIDRASRSIERIGDMSSGLSFLGQIESGISDIDINKKMDKVLEVLQPSIKRHSIKIIRDYSEIPPISIEKLEINRVFFCLIRNGIDAIKEKKLESKVDACITIQTLVEDQNLVILFKDNGIGMTDEIKQNMFKKFYSTKRPGEGTGLGMFFCKKNIESWGGKIYIESDFGVGTEIKMTIPVSPNGTTTR